MVEPFLSMKFSLSYVSFPEASRELFSAIEDPKLSYMDADIEAIRVLFSYVKQFTDV